MTPVSPFLISSYIDDIALDIESEFRFIDDLIRHVQREAVDEEKQVAFLQKRNPIRRAGKILK